MRKSSNHPGEGDRPREPGWLEGFSCDLRAALTGAPRDYTSGSIGKAIVLLAIPMVLEMSMQSIFAVVDIFFVSRLGPEAVASVGMTDSLLTLVFAVAMGLSMATTAVVARRVGEGDLEAASQSAAQGLLLGLVFAVPTGVAGVWFSADLLEIMGADDQIVNTGAGFAAIMLGGNVTVLLLFLTNAIFRGAGDAVIAMRTLWLANAVNMILDPILIFGWGFFPELGINGAAWATNIGRGLGVCYQFVQLSRRTGRLSIRAGQFRLQRNVMRRLLSISSAGALQFLVGTASWLAIMRILALFGGVAVAGYTISVRIIIFALLPSWGMGNAAATLVGQNLGAGKPDRAERSVWIAGATNALFLGILAILFIVFAEQLVGIFSAIPEVVAMGVRCLRTVSCSYVFLAFGMVTIQGLNGAGDTSTPTWINLFCYWALQIPLAYLLAVPFGFGPDGVFVSIAVAQSALAVVSVVVFRKGRWKGRSI